MTSSMFAVYRVLKSGKYVYLRRSVTSNRRLAEDIAAERTRGEVTTPTGRIVQVRPFPHIVLPVGGES